MSFWVYILHCADGSYYTGHTDNLEQRFAEHQSRHILGCYTATKLPVTLSFSQEFPTREEALSAERQIKGWSRAKKEALIRRDWAEISRLAKSKTGQAERPSTSSGRTGISSDRANTSSGRADSSNYQARHCDSRGNNDE